MDDVSRLDLYALLEIGDDAGEKEIKTAYRKNALKCHPDKNPDNPTAIQLFHQLSKALEVLTDTKARQAYDGILKARKAAEVRNRQLDSKRKKLKEDLESREREAELKSAAQIRTERPEDATKKLQAEIERLRREGSRQLEEEVELMRKQIKEEMGRLNDTAKCDLTNFPRIKVQWKQRKSATSPYDNDSLTKLFSKYGVVNCLVLSKKSRALVEFKSLSASNDVLNEIGEPDCPLFVKWVTLPPQQEPKPEDNFRPYRSSSLMAVSDENLVEGILSRNSMDDCRDYESLVMMKLRQAEERKRLVEQLKRQEEDGLTTFNGHASQQDQS